MIRGLAVCSGHGGIELGLRLALGDSYRCVGYVERDAYAAAALVARMEESALDRAPVWDDCKTFDGRAWRGKVDLLTAGYPCQPFSAAGRRRGESDPRHLWPHIRRIIGEIQPGLVFLENVANHLRLGFRAVQDDLRGMGYGVEAGLFSAGELGAPHRRERLFILAVADAKGDYGRGELATGEQGGDGRSGFAGIERAGQDEARRRGAGDVEYTGCECVGADEPQHEPERIGTPYAWPPGPGDADGWRDVLLRNPELAPALPTIAALREQPEAAEPAVRRILDGLAYRVDRLRGTGNGVVPVVAAKAFTCLLAKHCAGSGEAGVR